MDNGEEFPQWSWATARGHLLSGGGLAKSPRIGGEQSLGFWAAPPGWNRAEGSQKDLRGTNQGHNSHSEYSLCLGSPLPWAPFHTHPQRTQGPWPPSCSCPSLPSTSLQSPVSGPLPVSAPSSPASSPSDLPSFLPVLLPGCSPEGERNG